MSRRSHKNRRENRSNSSSNNNNTANNNRTGNGTNNMNSANNNNRQGNNGFGLNPNQLLASMFGNVDMGQINNILQSMNTQGFDFNNLNLGNLQGLMGNMGGNMGGNQNSNQGNSMNQNTTTEGVKNNQNSMSEAQSNKSEEFVGNDYKNNMRNDENIQMLKALRSIVDDERVEFIDKIIEKYNDGDFD